MKNIDPNDLIPMNGFIEGHPIKVKMIYALPNHKDNKFKGLYNSQATVLWAHKDLAPIILTAAALCKKHFNWSLQLNDCFRPVEAQTEMLAYDYHPDLVSTPGAGAHPRAMAIDIEPVGADGKPISMGTTFDHFVNDPKTDYTPAARDSLDFGLSPAFNLGVIEDRRKLSWAVNCASELCETPSYGLEQEWWDYRLLDSYSNKFNALTEADVHDYQRVVEIPSPAIVRSIARGDYPKAVGQAVKDVREKTLNTMSTSQYASLTF